MGQNGRPFESENIWHHILWRIISVSLSIKLLVGVAVIFCCFHSCCLNEFGFRRSRRARLLPRSSTDKGGLYLPWISCSVSPTDGGKSLWARTSYTTVFLIALFTHSRCQNEMLTVCSELSSLSVGVSELLIACDCWHCWTYPHYSTLVRRYRAGPGVLKYFISSLSCYFSPENKDPQ